MRPETRPGPTAREVRTCLTVSSGQGKTAIGLAMLVCGVACCLALLLTSLSLPCWPAQRLAACLNGVVIFLLLCAGHDATHGNLTSSLVLNRLIGRLAFLSSLTPYYENNRWLQYDGKPAAEST